MYWMLKNPQLKAYLIEKDIKVYNTWKYLLSCSIDDIINYPTPKINSQTDDFLIMTCSVSNATSKCNSMKYTERLEKVFNIQKNKLIKLHHLKDRIEIINDDYENIKNQECTWFIDPPYQLNNSVNKNTIFANGNGYSKLCNSDGMDYSALAEFCKSRLGQVIVCEKNLADWLPFQQLKNGKTSLGKLYKEVVWYN